MEGEGNKTNTDEAERPTYTLAREKDQILCCSKTSIYRTEFDHLATTWEIRNRKFTDILMVTIGLQVTCLVMGLACL
jgi:hypothetical protein